MKIVLDTTEIVSGSFWGGPSRKAIQRVYDGLDSAYVTDTIMNEIRNVLMRSKFQRSDEVKERAIAKIEMVVKKVSVSSEQKTPLTACRDPKDIKFLECAVAAKADCIISGDADLLDLKEYNGIKILNAKEYLETVNLR